MPQSLVKIYVHIIFSTKNHVHFLAHDTIRNQMHAYLAKIFMNYDSPAIIVGGANEHIHELVQVSKNYLIPKIIGEVKRSSSKWVKNKSTFLSKFQWQNGYGAFSVGQSMIPNLKKYIVNQIKHHHKISFKEEYIAFLKKYKIDYDERYLWD